MVLRCRGQRIVEAQVMLGLDPGMGSERFALI